jgi:MYXO-CTERM domain-containing protein
MRSLLVLLLLGVSGTAAAHIHITFPLGRTDSLTGNDQKEQHCGAAVGRTARVTQFQPGQTITVTWAETIDHPGWYRIAFQPDGEVFGIPPASNGPNGLGGAANFPTLNQEGLDPINNSIVLKDRIPDGTLSTDITFPNMECANCTLQFIQVMIDKQPYTEDLASDDVYFNCADITLSSAPLPPDAGPGDPDAGTGGNNNGGDGEVSGGCSTSTPAYPIGLALLGLALARRRRASPRS